MNVNEQKHAAKSLAEDLERLRLQIRKSKKSLKQSEMKTEQLNAAIQAASKSRENLKRRPSQK